MEQLDNRPEPPISVPAGDPAAGKLIYAAECQICHKIDGNGEGANAPTLQGLVGKQAGTSAGFRYTKAMKKSGIIWSKAHLWVFL